MFSKWLRFYLFGGSVVKNPPAVQEFDPWVRMIPWRGNDDSLQYSCLGNPTGRGASQAPVYGAVKDWMQLS